MFKCTLHNIFENFPTRFLERTGALEHTPAWSVLAPGKFFRLRMAIRCVLIEKPARTARLSGVGQRDDQVVAGNSRHNARP